MESGSARRASQRSCLSSFAVAGGAPFALLLPVETQERPVLAHLRDPKPQPSFVVALALRGSRRLPLRLVRSLRLLGRLRLLRAEQRVGGRPQPTQELG